MKTKRVFSRLLIIVIAVILFISSLIIYVTYGSYMREKYVYEYLKNNGYNDSEIQEIRVDFAYMNYIKGSQSWNIQVIFEDEPTVCYYYSYESKKISQSGVSGGSVDIEKKNAEQWYYVN